MKENIEEKIKFKMTRQLDDTYIVIHIIKNEIKLRVDNKLINKNLVTLLGLNVNSEKTIIDIKIEKEDDNHFWLDELELLKSRGINNIFYISSGDNKNLQRAIRISFPETKFICSLTSIITTIYKYVSYRSRSLFTRLIKEIFIQETYEDCENKLLLLKEKYKDNIIVLKLIESRLDNVKIYYEYDKQMRELLFNHFKATDIFDRINKILESKGYIDDVKEIWDNLYEYIEHFETNKGYSKVDWARKINSLSKYNKNILDLIIKE